MRVLGVSAFYHDSAAVLVDGGRVVAAAQEERFTRRKHDAAYPEHAVAWCLAEGGTRPGELDRVVFYDKPFLKFERLLETAVAFAPRGFPAFAKAMPAWVKDKLFQKSLLARKLAALDGNVDWHERLLFAEHHQSHAASAFYPSPFREAAVLTMDGVGEWATTSAAVGSGAALEVTREVHFPHSLGLLYSAFTYYTGFRVNSGEYKVMGLAPYGRPAFAQRILDELIDLKPDGTFRLNLDYFDYCTGLKMTNRRFDALFGGPARAPADPLRQRHMDLAASVQAVVEESVLRLTRSLREETGLNNLCLAGGVALNCVANGKVVRDGTFDAVWVQPAAGDAGGALGAALAASHGLLGQPRWVGGRAFRATEDGAGGRRTATFEGRGKVVPATAGATRDLAHGGVQQAQRSEPLAAVDAAAQGGATRDQAAKRNEAPAAADAMRGAFLGPLFGNAEVREALDAAAARYRDLDDRALLEATAGALAEGKVVGWFQGRMEFGPRALGARSILGDPRDPAMQRTLNLKVKFRESFRPFAPSVLASDAAEWFELDRESPYMLLVAGVAERRRRPEDPQAERLFGLDKLHVPRSDVPAVTHVDHSARIQTVHAETNPRYHALIEAFKARTGCPVLVNTSFNVRGEPIVCTPADAFRCFMGTDMDCLAIENCFLRKEEQDAALAVDYKDSFEPD